MTMTDSGFPVRLKVTPYYERSVSRSYNL